MSSRCEKTGFEAWTATLFKTAAGTLRSITRMGNVVAVLFEMADEVPGLLMLAPSPAMDAGNVAGQLNSSMTVEWLVPPFSNVEPTKPSVNIAAPARTGAQKTELHAM